MYGGAWGFKREYMIIYIWCIGIVMHAQDVDQRLVLPRGQDRSGRASAAATCTCRGGCFVCDGASDGKAEGKASHVKTLNES